MKDPVTVGKGAIATFKKIQNQPIERQCFLLVLFISFDRLILNFFERGDNPFNVVTGFSSTYRSGSGGIEQPVVARDRVEICRHFLGRPCFHIKHAKGMLGSGRSRPLYLARGEKERLDVYNRFFLGLGPLEGTDLPEFSQM